MDTPNSQRRWFQFTLRESMLLVALAATGVGWYVDHKRIAELAIFTSVLDQTIEAHRIDRTARSETGLVYRGDVFRITIEPRN